MYEYKRKVIALLIALAMVVTLTPSLGLAYAEDEGSAVGSAEGEITQVVEGEVERFMPDQPEDAEEADELYTGYIRNKAYNSSERKSVGKRLKFASERIYDHLNEAIAEVAEGNRESTEFVFSMQDLFGGDVFWTAEELGLTTLTDQNGELTDTAINTVQDFDAIIFALLADNPYTLYWYDKTSWTESYPLTCYLQVTETGEERIWVTGEVRIRMPVSSGYSKSGKSGTYEINTELGKSASQIISNAYSILSKYNGCSEQEKLRGYADEICKLVSYNNSAAGSNQEDKNPWQLIWVFDGDPNTNVVCEGYAKAFKFLCDITEFESDIDCITVTGDLDGGGHMWNIVTLADGYNYLVDVTNSDGGSKMVDNGLILCKEPNGGEYPTYQFRVSNGTNKYTYDAETRRGYSKNELLIPGDGTGHIPTEDPVDEPTQIESLSFQFRNITFYEGFGGSYGYYDEEWNYVESPYFYYDYDPYIDVYTKGNRITVNGKTYTCNEDQEFVAADGSRLFGSITSEDNQSETNHWTIDNPGQVTIHYKDGSCTVPVPIEKSPVTEFRIEFAEEQVLYGGRDDYECGEYIFNNETGEAELVYWRCFWYGESRVRNCSDGDVLVLNGTRYTCYIDGDTNTGVFKSKSGKTIPEDVLYMVDGQSYYNQWKPGEHEVTTYYYIDGRVAGAYKSTVIVYANPIESFRFVPSAGFKVVKVDDDYYFSYEIGDKFIINYNDGRGEVEYILKPVPDPEGGYENVFLDANGKEPIDGHYYVQPLYSRIGDDWKPGRHTFYMRLFGRETEFEGRLSYKWDDFPVVDNKSIKISKLTGGKKSATVKWKKISTTNRKKIKKVQIQYSTSKSFTKNVKSKLVSSSKTSAKLTGLKKGKKYYVRIRSYRSADGVAHVGKWSKAKSVKAK